MDEHHKEKKRFLDVLKALVTIEPDKEPITCDECFNEVDRYVDMLRAGQSAEDVLPHIKTHLSECRCCQEELEALIRILESGEQPSL